MAYNNLIDKIEKFTDCVEWERMACDILSKLGYRGITPQSPTGGADGGKDALWNDSMGDVGIHISLQKDYEQKIHKDLEKCKDKNFKKVVFFTNRSINGERQDKLKEFCKKTLGIPLEIFDQEAIRVEVENNRPDLLDKFDMHNRRIEIENAELLSVLYQNDQTKQLEILAKQINQRLTSDNVVTVVDSSGIPQLRINKKLWNLINFTTTLKIKQGRLGKYKDVKDYIENKLTHGEDVIFTEDEIENFEIKGERINISDGKLKSLKLSPEPLGEPILIDIGILDSILQYEKIQFAPVSKNEGFTTLRTFNSELIMIIEIPSSPESINKIKSNIKIQLDPDCRDVSKEIKFNQFMQELKDKKTLIFNDFSTKKFIVKANVDVENISNQNWLEILFKLKRIEQFFNIHFISPNSLDYEQLDRINFLTDAILQGYTKRPFTDLKIKLDSNAIENLLKLQKNCVLYDFKIDYTDSGVTLLDNDIKLGNYTVIFPPLKINDIQELEKRIKEFDNAEISLQSVDEKECTIQFNLSTSPSLSYTP